MSEELAAYNGEAPAQPAPDTEPRMSDKIDKLAQALTKAQAEMRNAVKDGENPHFGSSYATLGEILDTIREPLSKHGLAVVQLPSATADTVTVETRLLHDSGQWMRSALTFRLRPEYSKSGRELPPSPQQVGSAITYGRRYGLSAMVGVGAVEDDDGNLASREGTPPVTVAAPPATPPVPRGARRYITGPKAGTEVPATPAAPAPEAPAPAPEPDPEPAAHPAPTFHTMLYDRCEASGVTLEEVNADLRERGQLKGQMTVDNLPASTIQALCEGVSKKSGRANWDCVVDRIMSRRQGGGN